MTKDNYHNYSIDIIKTVAIFNVIAWHFFVLHTPFRSTEFVGFSMFTQAFFMKVFQTGVPLFCLCTGYLNYKKDKYNKTFFKGILKTLSSYFFFCIIIYLFRNNYLNENITLHEALKGLLRFDLIPYGWYIEMWIGLYLLTPLINKALNNCSKKEELIICIIIFFLTSLPNTFNIFGHYFFPAFWNNIWPLTYFVAGRFIRDYYSADNLNLNILLTIIIIFSLIEPIINIINTESLYYKFCLGSQNQNILIVPTSIAFFILLLRIKTKPLKEKCFFEKTSKYTLDMYLCCYMFDALLYPFFLTRFFNEQSTFWPFFFIIVPLCFIFSFLTAWIKSLLFSFLKIEKIWKTTN